MIAERTPSEVSLDWVYLPPFLVAVLLGYFAAFVLTRLLNRLRWSQFFWRPEIAFLSLWVLFTSWVGLFWFPP